jgi:hypothetical protein
VPEQEPVNLWALADLCTPWCLHVVVTLRIADHITAGLSDIADLAQATDSDTYALHRVLTYLVGKGVFLEPEPGRFAMNEPAKALQEPAWRITLDLNGIGGRLSGAWATLPKYVQTGKPAYAEAFGLPFWEDLDAHPDIHASFDALIGSAGHGTPNPEFQITGGWGAIQTIVDVGGGTGGLLAEVLRIHPHLRGTLVDQPETVARAGEIFEKAGVAERARAVGQSFFDLLPAGADLYILKGILNDFPDDGATAILGRCAEAARPNGRVIVLGGVVNDGEPRPLTIEMVLLGGKYRTVNELKGIAREAGLEVTAAGRQPSGYFVVECRPV